MKQLSANINWLGVPTTVYLKFSYENVTKTVKKITYDNLVKTTCTLSTKQGEKMYDVIAEGEAIQSPADQHVAETARRISLGRAIEDLGIRAQALQIALNTPQAKFGISKEDRHAIWSAYFTRCNSGIVPKLKDVEAIRKHKAEKEAKKAAK